MHGCSNTAEIRKQNTPEMMIRLLIRTPDDSPDLKLGYDGYMQSSLRESGVHCYSDGVTMATLGQAFKHCFVTSFGWLCCQNTVLSAQEQTKCS